jgi:hypothetical protein
MKTRTVSWNKNQKDLSCVAKLILSELDIAGGSVTDAECLRGVCSSCILASVNITFLLLFLFSPYTPLAKIISCSDEIFHEISWNLFSWKKNSVKCLSFMKFHMSISLFEAIKLTIDDNCVPCGRWGALQYVAEGCWRLRKKKSTIAAFCSVLTANTSVCKT